MVMWPFSSSDDEEPCDHEWEGEVSEIIIPNDIYSMDGQPYILREQCRFAECNNCGKRELIDCTNEKVVLSVDRVEEL